MIRYLVLFAFAFSELSSAQSNKDLREFAASRRWQTLLHMHSGITGLRSKVHGPAFFRANDGSTDPLAELDADLRELTNPASNFSCQFPLRTKRLIEAFHIAAPPKDCSQLRVWLKALDANSVRFVFASAFPEAPPSMFGHTFFQLSSKSLSDDSDSGLLANGINFAAIIPPDAGIEMAYKGLFGGYEGHFTVSPFYQMLSEYSYTEERDLWVYELNLTPDETEDLLLHIWEIETNHAFLPYYFIDENCAFQLLSILEAVRPANKLQDEFGVYSLPLTSLQILERHGFLSNQLRVKRAPAKQVRETLVKLSSDERIEFDKTVAGIASPATPTKILDLAIRKLTAEKQSVRGRFRPDKDEQILVTLLRERAKRGVTPKSVDQSTQDDKLDDPRHAHLPSAVQLGGGIFQDVDGHVAGRGEFLYKPALHNLLERGPGFGEGMFLDVFPTTLRFSQNDKDKPQVNLHKFELIHIGVFQPVTAERTSSSWTIASSFEPDTLEGPRTFRMTGRTGLTSRTGIPRTVGYSLLGIDVAKFAQTTNGWLGPGVTLGLASGDAWDTHQSSKLAWRLEGDMIWTVRRSDEQTDRPVRKSLTAEGQFYVSKYSESSVRLAAKWMHFDKIQREFYLTWDQRF